MDLDFTEFAKVVSEYQGLTLDEIHPESMIGSDLGMAGDDVADFIDMLSTTYGADFSLFPLADVAGPEAGFNPFAFILAKLRNEKPHDVSLSQLFDAVVRGKW